MQKVDMDQNWHSQFWPSAQGLGPIKKKYIYLYLCNFRLKFQFHLEIA